MFYHDSLLLQIPYFRNKFYRCISYSDFLACLKEERIFVGREREMYRATVKSFSSRVISLDFE